MEKKRFNIVLFAPEIPGNTGSVGRTCVALDLNLILIKPYGFDISEKAVRRAGLDYWKHVQIKEYESWQDFMDKESPAKEKLIFFENDGSDSYFNANYQEDCYLIFGGETKGLPKEIYENYHDRMVYLPMRSEHIRSLNLSNTVTAAAYECFRHLKL